MAQQKTTSDILANAQQTLETARSGLLDASSDNPERRLSGLRNLVVFGRAVTNVLQNLRSTEAQFEEWYTPFVQEMEADPLMRYLYKLRSEILKEGNVPTGTSTRIHHLDFPRDLTKFGPVPANAKRFFIGDRNGGSGWEVELADGSMEKYYVDLPPDLGVVSVHLTGAPTEHRGQQLADSRIETIGAAYLTYLGALVSQAKTRFGGAT